MLFPRVKALCGLGALWEHGQRGHPEPVPLPSGAGQPGGHRGDTESVSGAVAGHSRAGGISGAQTSGTRGLEWHHGLGVAWGEPQERAVVG